MSGILNAIVKYPAGRILETKYGEKVNAVFMAGDEEIKIWADANSQKAETLKQLTKGEHKLILDDNGKYKLLEDEKPQTNGNGNGKTKPDYAPLTPDKKREIATYIKDMAGLYGFCLEQAKTLNKEGSELPAEAVKDIAKTLFIASQKHFNL